MLLLAVVAGERGVLRDEDGNVGKENGGLDWNRLDLGLWVKLFADSMWVEMERELKKKEGGCGTGAISRREL